MGGWGGGGGCEDGLAGEGRGERGGEEELDWIGLVWVGLGWIG